MNQKRFNEIETVCHHLNGLSETISTNLRSLKSSMPSFTDQLPLKTYQNHADRPPSGAHLLRSEKDLMEIEMVVMKKQIADLERRLLFANLTLDEINSRDTRDSGTQTDSSSQTPSVNSDDLTNRLMGLQTELSEMISRTSNAIRND